MEFLIHNFPWTKILWPCVSLFLVVVFIILVRWFGKFENKAEAVGSDLNLTTFGFAADLLVQLMRGKAILSGWNYGTPVLVLVIGLFLLNLLFYMFNLRLAEKIAGAIKAKKKTWVIKLLKSLGFSLGLLSASMFIAAQALWD